MCKILPILLAAFTFMLAAGLISAAPAPDEPKKEKPSAEEIKKVHEQVEKELAKLQPGNARPPLIQPITDDAIVQTLPKYLFFSVFYRQWPVGMAPPQGLRPSNIFVVTRNADAKSQILTDVKELETFLKTALPPVDTDDKAKDTVRSALLLYSALKQDGMYQFVIQDDSIKVAAEDKGKKATGKTIVMRGGNGEITAALTFDAAGKLTNLTHEANIKMGPRPICQATKLLDTDPIVRRMAEQDLLIMGRAAKPYLDEQRAKASSELQQAIDAIWRRIVEVER